MSALIRIGGTVLLAVAVYVAPSLDGRRAARLLRPTEASVVVGGEICALDPVNSTKACNDPGRTCEDGGILYKCDGTNLDQFCPAATKQTNNICNQGKATCGGKQSKDTGLGWVEDGECKKCQFDTARLQSDTTCTKAGG